MSVKEIDKRLSKLEESLRPPDPMLFLISDEEGNDKWVTIEAWLEYSKKNQVCWTKVRTGTPVNYDDLDRYLENVRRHARERFSK